MKTTTQTGRRPTPAELRNRTPLDGEPIPSKAIAPIDKTAPRATAVALNKSYRERYLDEVATTSIAGRLIKFDKGGKFVTPDDSAEVSEDQDFVALCDEVMVGWIKFNGVGEAPDREMGLLYDGFEMPPRESMGDTDKTQWEEGLDGKPADPWQHQMLLVLQQADTKELFTFVTSSITGRRAVGTLLRHYDRMRRSGSDDLPVVRLRPGSFKHRDERVGWVNVPTFVVFGKTPRDSAAKPDTSTAGYLNDSLDGVFGS
jgi:hypothetical protein